MNKHLVAALTALLLLISPAFSAATLDKAVCSAADRSAGDPAVCTGQELIDSATQEINHAYDIGAPVAAYVSGTNNIIATTTPSTLTLVDGGLYQIKPGVTNTGAVQLNLNSLGLKSVASASGSALGAGDLQSSTIYIVRYYASLDQFRVLTSLGTGNASASNSYLTIGNTAALSAERAITAGIGLGGTDGGANSTWTVNITDTELVCILGQTSAADKISYWSGSGTCGLADFPSTFRTFLT